MHFLEAFSCCRGASALGHLGGLFACGRVVSELTQATLHRLLISRLPCACLLNARSRIRLGRRVIIGAASLHLPARRGGNDA
jgi:hypothetical protein